MHRARQHRLVRLWPVAAIIAVAAVIGAVLVPLSAEASGVALSGTVSNASGTKLGGVTVTALPQYGQGNSAQTTTSSTGAFAFASLFHGTYTLSFSATSTTFAQYLGNTSSLNDAEFIVMFEGADGQNHTYLNASLSNSGSITGKVSKLPSGALSKYTVRAFSQGADGSWSVDHSALTSSSGAYSLTGLEPGEYRLEAIDLTSAHPAYSPVFSGGATEVGSAAPVGVVANKNTSYNFALGNAGSVSGTVSGNYDGSHTQPLAGTRVSVYRVDGSSAPWSPVTPLDSPSAMTSSTGAYTLSGLAPGRYTLEFTPPSTSSASPGNQIYGKSLLGNTTDATNAGTLVIGNATTLTGADIVLQPQASVTGTVTSADDNSALSNIRVSIDYAGRNHDAPNEDAPTVLTGSDGTFAFHDLGPGNYDLWVGSTNDTNVTSNQAGDTTRIRQLVTVPTLTPGETATVPVSLATNPHSGLGILDYPTISNDGTSVGDQLSIDSYGTWGDPDLTSADFALQWTRNGRPISGATGTTYVLKPGDETQRVSLDVTATSFGYGTRTVEAEGGPNVVQPGVLNDPFPMPSIAGNTTVGSTLTLTDGAYAVTGVALSYDWQYEVGSSGNWVDTGEPGTRTHVITVSDWHNSSHLRVQVTARRAGYTDNTVWAYPGDTTQQGTLSLVTPPKFKKTSAGWTVVGGTWSQSAFDSVDYQWNVSNPDGTQAEPSPTTSVLPLAGTEGKTITMFIRHNLLGYQGVNSPLLTVQLAGPAVASGDLTVSGPAEVGVTLYAPTPTWTPVNGTSTYQWQYKSGSKWKNYTADATNNYFSTSAGDLGRVLRVAITRSESGLQDAVVDSTATAKLGLGPADGTSVAPSISGNPGTGDTLTATTGTWAYPDGKYSFQWSSTTDPEFGTLTKIAGATGSSFVVPQSLVGKYIFVAVTSKVPGHQDGTRDARVGGDSAVAVSADLRTPLKAATPTRSGTIYTVKGGTFTPAAAAGATSYLFEYYNESTSSWVVSSTEKPATGSTSVAFNTATTTQPDARWGVVVEADAGGADGYNKTDAPIVVLGNGTISVASGALTLGSFGRVGQAITITQPTWSVTSPGLKYQWRYETTPTSGSWKNIAASSGGTSPTFTPSATYENKVLDLVETASKAGYTSVPVVSTPTTVNIGVAATAGTGANAPSISGADNIGATLTALPGTWNATGLTFHFRWSVSTDDANWTAIPGATSSKYLIPDSADGTDYFLVQITASRTGYNDGIALLDTDAKAGDGTLIPGKLPTVSVKAGKYTVKPGTWTPGATAVDYEWLLYDTATDSFVPVGEDSNTFTPNPGDASKKLVVDVLGNRDGYDTSLLAVVAHAGPTISSSSSPAFNQNPSIGAPLSVQWGTWSTPSPTIGEQWYINGKATTQSLNSTTFIPTPGDLGKTISVKLMVSKYGYSTNTYTLKSAPVFSDVALAATTAPAISGTPDVDSTITVSTGVWNASGLSYSYRWYRNDKQIRGATASSYVVSVADAGQEITAEVTASKANYFPVAAATVGVTAEDGDPIDVTGPAVTVTGTPAIGNTLTAKLGAFALPVNVEYFWFASSSGTPNSWTEISGESSNTYTVKSVDGIAPGWALELRVEVSRAGHVQEEFDSPPVIVTGAP